MSHQHLPLRILLRVAGLSPAAAATCRADLVGLGWLVMALVSRIASSFAAAAEGLASSRSFPSGQVSPSSR